MEINYQQRTTPSGLNVITIRLEYFFEHFVENIDTIVRRLQDAVSSLRHLGIIAGQVNFSNRVGTNYNFNYVRGFDNLMASLNYMGDTLRMLHFGVAPYNLPHYQGNKVSGDDGAENAEPYMVERGTIRVRVYTQNENDGQLSDEVYSEGEMTEEATTEELRTPSTEHDTEIYSLSDTEVYSPSQTIEYELSDTEPYELSDTEIYSPSQTIEYSPSQTIEYSPSQEYSVEDQSVESVQDNNEQIFNIFERLEPLDNTIDTINLMQDELTNLINNNLEIAYQGYPVNMSLVYDALVNILFNWRNRLDLVYDELRRSRNPDRRRELRNEATLILRQAELLSENARLISGHFNNLQTDLPIFLQEHDDSAEDEIRMLQSELENLRALREDTSDTIRDLSRRRQRREISNLIVQLQSQNRQINTRINVLERRLRYLQQSA